MKTIALDQQNMLAFRETPWDAAIFGFKTSELLSVSYKDHRAVEQLLDLFDQANREGAVRFTYTRVAAQDLLLKQALQDRGFYFAETTCKVGLNITDGTNFSAILKSNLGVAPAIPEDYPQIKAIAQGSFNYGRFVEDPYLSPELTRIRNGVWIDDMVRRGKQALVYRKGGLVRSFMIYHTAETKCELILGGSDQNLGYLTPLFWSAVFSQLQQSGVRRIETTISAANVVIFNIYSLFGFKLHATLFGFHKFYTPSPKEGTLEQPLSLRK